MGNTMLLVFIATFVVTTAIAVYVVRPSAVKLPTLLGASALGLLANVGILVLVDSDNVAVAFSVLQLCALPVQLKCAGVVRKMGTFA